jgi:hypothetical protein
MQRNNRKKTHGEKKENRKNIRRKDITQFTERTNGGLLFVCFSQMKRERRNENYKAVKRRLLLSSFEFNFKYSQYYCFCNQYSHVRSGLLHR